MTEGRGIFPPGTARHGPPSAKRLAAHRARLNAARERRIVMLADLVSEGWTITAAARQMGVSQQSASKMWRDIVYRLGDQAV